MRRSRRRLDTTSQVRSLFWASAEVELRVVERGAHDTFGPFGVADLERALHQTHGAVMRRSVRALRVRPPPLVPRLSSLAAASAGDARASRAREIAVLIFLFGGVITAVVSGALARAPRASRRLFATTRGRSPACGVDTFLDNHYGVAGLTRGGGPDAAGATRHAAWSSMVAQRTVTRRVVHGYACVVW